MGLQYSILVTLGRQNFLPEQKVCLIFGGGGHTWQHFGVLLNLHSEMTPERLMGPYGTLGIELESGQGKSSPCCAIYRSGPSVPHLSKSPSLFCFLLIIPIS